MTFPKEFFSIILTFAEKASALTHCSLEEALLNYTNLYKACNIPHWDFDQQETLWQDLFARFQASQDKVQAMYDFYLLRLHEGDKEERKRFGRFSYKYDQERNNVRIHFKDGLPHALARDNMETRKAELRDMFTDIRHNYPRVENVVGFSWLYNINAYTRLFPQAYTEHPKQVSWFRSLARWGQFFDSKSNLNQDMVETFLTKVSQASTLDDLERSFPYPVLQTECPINYFYEFYGIA